VRYQDLAADLSRFDYLAETNEGIMQRPPPSQQSITSGKRSIKGNEGAKDIFQADDYTILN